MKRLANKVAVITGGNSGIGFATAKEFIAQGAKVIITGRKQDAVNQAVKELGENAYGIVSDAGKFSDIEHLPNQVKDFTSKIDVLFVNAGIGKFIPIEAVDEQHFDETFGVNVKGAYFTIQKLLPLINDGGSIILNTSISANIGMPNSSVYSASKAALLTFARTLSAELLGRRIRVNAISPGPIATPIFGKMGIPEEQAQQMADSIQQQIPIGRFGNPEEIAKVATFFASDDSTFVLGFELVADGGMSTL